MPSIDGEELTRRLSELDGRLAVGNGPELAVVRPDGGRVEWLDGSESTVAAQPTWSHDGSRLAWSSASAERQVVLVQDLDDDGRLDGEPRSTDAAGPPVFYLQWNQADDRLAYIRNSVGGGVVEVGTIEPGLPVNPVGEGAPFFVSWSPSPDRLLGHVNEDSIDLYNPAADPELGFGSVVAIDGGFSAPAWVDDRRALVVADGRLSYLDVETGATEAIIDIEGPVRFVLSPDRSRVAYQLVGGGGDLSLVGYPAAETVQLGESGLVVLDLATAEQTVVTGDLAVAWDWSPDGRNLAWLEAEIAGGRPLGRWHFWSDDATPATERSAQFAISRKYGQAYLPFFAQYAQSVTGWSPDSSAFAFAGTVDRERGIWIQLVDERVAPRLVAPGDVVTWGPGRLPEPEPGNSAA